MITGKSKEVNGEKMALTSKPELIEFINNVIFKKEDTLKFELNKISNEYNVPVEVIKIIGWYNKRWSINMDNNIDTDKYLVYGPFALSDIDGSIQLASDLTGINRIFEKGFG